MAKSSAKPSMNFEQATGRLEEIVARIDNPETGLEEMLQLVEEGLQLINRSRKLLAEAELKIRKLEAPEEAPESKDGNDDGFSLI